MRAYGKSKHSQDTDGAGTCAEAINQKRTFGRCSAFAQGQNRTIDQALPAAGSSLAECVAGGGGGPPTTLFPPELRTFLTRVGNAGNAERSAAGPGTSPPFSPLTFQLSWAAALPITPRPRKRGSAPRVSRPFTHSARSTLAQGGPLTFHLSLLTFHGIRVPLGKQASADETVKRCVSPGASDFPQLRIARSRMRRLRY